MAVSDPDGLARGVVQVLDVLEYLSSEGPQPLGRIAQASGLSKPTAHRTLTALLSRGYVKREPGGSYLLGLRCIQLGTAVLAGVRVDAARPHLDTLNARTGEVVHLAVYDQTDVVYVAKLDAVLPVAPQSQVGQRAPSHCVAPGLALLAYQPAAEIDLIIAAGLRRFTEHTITDPADLNRELARTRSRGYAVNRSAWREGVCGVGAVVRDYTGVPVAAVACCVPQSRFATRRRSELASAVTTAATAISTDLGLAQRVTT